MSAENFSEFCSVEKLNSPALVDAIEQQIFPAHPGFSVNPIFAEDGQLSASLYDKRSAGIRFDTLQGPFTLKFKGNNLGLVDVSLDTIVAKAESGLLPGGLPLHGVAMEMQHAALARRVAIDGKLDKPASQLPLYILDNLMSADDFYSWFSEILSLKLPEAMHYMIPAYIENWKRKEILPGGYVSLIAGYDVRISALASHLFTLNSIEGCTDPFLNYDRMFTNNPTPGTAGGFVGGDWLMSATGKSLLEITQATYSMVEHAYQKGIQPFIADDRALAFKALHHYRSQIDSGRQVVKNFIDNLIPFVIQSHYQGFSFSCAPKEGSSLIPRNLGLGTKDYAAINDLITFGNFPQGMASQFMYKDYRELLLSVAGLSRLWYPEVGNFGYTYLVNNLVWEAEKQGFGEFTSNVATIIKHPKIQNLASAIMLT